MFQQLQPRPTLKWRPRLNGKKFNEPTGKDTSSKCGPKSYLAHLVAFKVKSPGRVALSEFGVKAPQISPQAQFDGSAIIGRALNRNQGDG